MKVFIEDLKIFVISLIDSDDRRDIINKNLNKLQITPCFIDAVDGKAMSDYEMRKNCDQNKAKKILGRELLAGEVGCALSHRKVCKKIVKEKIPYAIILEDDAVIHDDFIEAVNSIFESKLSWDIVLLGHHGGSYKGVTSPLSIWKKKIISPKFSLNRLADFGYGTYGYFISLQGAEKILGKTSSIYKPIDHYTCSLRVANVYALYPVVVDYNKLSVTTIDRDNKLINRNKKFKKIFKDLGLLRFFIKFKKIFIFKL